MPYPRAHYYVLVVMAVIVAGFWPSYFTVWSSVPWQSHPHGIPASLWVMMVLAQSWTAHHRQLPLHRAGGKASLLLFPFLIGGPRARSDRPPHAPWAAGGELARAAGAIAVAARGREGAPAALPLPDRRARRDHRRARHGLRRRRRSP